ncbi:hypothetical protein [Streptomyces sp. Root369]|uniref:hypothetical protein n=1 Tax=Streptomyces sp. Root369 TaxID=1736523 RepID=UPI000AFF0B5B|nr:hypothetical protein [Streptomyces sp. Root369]
MANLVYKRVSTDQQSTVRQNLVLGEAGIEDPVVLRGGRAAPPAAPTRCSGRSSANCSPTRGFVDDDSWGPTATAVTTVPTTAVAATTDPTSRTCGTR